MPVIDGIGVEARRRRGDNNVVGPGLFQGHARTQLLFSVTVYRWTLPPRWNVIRVGAGQGSLDEFRLGHFGNRRSSECYAANYQWLRRRGNMIVCPLLSGLHRYSWHAAIIIVIVGLIYCARRRSNNSPWQLQPKPAQIRVHNNQPDTKSNPNPNPPTTIVYILCYYWTAGNNEHSGN